MQDMHNWVWSLATLPLACHAVMRFGRRKCACPRSRGLWKCACPGSRGLWKCACPRSRRSLRKCACPRSRVLRDMCLSSIARSVGNVPVLDRAFSGKCACPRSRGLWKCACPRSRRSTKCAWPLRSRRSIGGAREFWIGIEDGCARVVAGSANAVRRLANAIRPQASAAAGSARRSVRRGPRGCGCWIHNHDSARVCRAPSRARRERVDTRGSGT